MPAAFFAAVLGPAPQVQLRLLARGRDAILAEAEAAALEATCERAGLADGQRILELGCGWGSLTLWMAERYPAQPHHRRLELALAARAHRGRGRRGAASRNVEVHHRRHERASTPTQRFDRIVSVEMFEHMRNWRGALRARRTTGSRRAGASSCTSSATAARRTRSSSAAPATG